MQININNIVVGFRLDLTDSDHSTVSPLVLLTFYCLAPRTKMWTYKCVLVGHVVGDFDTVETGTFAHPMLAGVG